MDAVTSVVESLPIFADAVGGYWGGLLSRVLHTTCGATLLGGTVYLRFVLAPAVGDDPAAVCFAGRRKAWAACVGVCSLLLLASGFYNLTRIVGEYELPGGYAGAIGLKFVLALALMVVAMLVAGKSAGAEKVRGRLTVWLNVALALALSVFVLGAYLRSLDKIPKPPAIESEAPAFDAPAAGDAPASDTGPEFPSLPTLPGP